MYSWEIQQLMELRNYLITVKEYMDICSNSPQINRVSYNAFNNEFMISTDDNYNWQFKVKKEELK